MGTNFRWREMRGRGVVANDFCAVNDDWARNDPSLFGKDMGAEIRLMPYVNKEPPGSGRRDESGNTHTFINLWRTVRERGRVGKCASRVGPVSITITSATATDADFAAPAVRYPRIANPSLSPGPIPHSMIIRARSTLSSTPFTSSTQAGTTGPHSTSLKHSEISHPLSLSLHYAPPRASPSTGNDVPSLQQPLVFKREQGHTEYESERGSREVSWEGLVADVDGGADSKALVFPVSSSSSSCPSSFLDLDPHPVAASKHPPFEVGEEGVSYSAGYGFGEKLGGGRGVCAW